MPESEPRPVDPAGGPGQDDPDRTVRHVRVEQALLNLGDLDTRVALSVLLALVFAALLSVLLLLYGTTTDVGELRDEVDNISTVPGPAGATGPPGATVTVVVIPGVGSTVLPAVPATAGRSQPAGTTTVPTRVAPPGSTSTSGSTTTTRPTTTSTSGPPSPSTSCATVLGVTVCR